MKLIALADAAVQPWKNGGGTTRELLRLPLPGGAPDEWLLRISVAEIARDGPFSAYPGITRWFAVLAGAGVVLDWAEDWRAGLTPSSHAIEFDGADAPDCALPAGPTRDLNVMVRRDRARAFLGRAALGAPWAWPGRARGLLTLRPLVLEHGGERRVLPAEVLAWDDAGARAAWSLHPLAADAPAAPDAGAAPPAWWIGLLDG